MSFLLHDSIRHSGLEAVMRRCSDSATNRVGGRLHSRPLPDFELAIGAAIQLTQSGHQNRCAAFWALGGPLCGTKCAFAAVARMSALKRDASNALSCLSCDRCHNLMFVADIPKATSSKNFPKRADRSLGVGQRQKFCVPCPHFFCPTYEGFRLVRSSKQAHFCACRDTIYRTLTERRLCKNHPSLTDYLKRQTNV